MASGEVSLTSAILTLSLTVLSKSNLIRNVHQLSSEQVPGMD